MYRRPYFLAGAAAVVGAPVLLYLGRPKVNVPAGWNPSSQDTPSNHLSSQLNHPVHPPHRPPLKTDHASDIKHGVKHEGQENHPVHPVQGPPLKLDDVNEIKQIVEHELHNEAKNHPVHPAQRPPLKLDRASEIRHIVKHEGHDQAKKLQEMYIEQTGTSGSTSQRIRDKTEEARKQAAEKDNTWFKYGIHHATEGGKKDIECGKTDKEAWQIVNELKRELVVTAEEMKDLAKDDVKDNKWGDKNYEKSEMKKVIEEGQVIVEATKRTPASRSLLVDPFETMKDNTIMAHKKALELETANAHAHAQRHAHGH